MKENWDLAQSKVPLKKNQTPEVSMFLHVIEAKYISGYNIWAKFNDGSSGEIDLSSDLDEGIFKKLQGIKYFINFSLDGHTLYWENGADFAPEYLREKLN